MIRHPLHFALPLLLGAQGFICLGCSSDDEQDGLGTPSFNYPLDDVLRVDHVQVKSTHNSYHVETEGNTLQDWAYTHLPLQQQLSQQGVRHVELDVRRNADTGIFEVYHLPVVDELTTCLVFTECLSELKAWSDTHRAHHFIVVQIEFKDVFPGQGVEAYFEALEAEIESVWPRERIITPAEVQGTAPTLRDAVAARAWPTLGRARGSILFSVDNTSTFRNAYTHGSTSLDGRLMFVDSDPSEPFAAVAVLNDPVGDADRIAEALEAGLLVRTRADSGGVEAFSNDRSRLEAALSSGAHFITTDFPASVQGLAYWVDLPGGTPSRCNPVTAPADCTSLAVEDPSFVGP